MRSTLTALVVCMGIVASGALGMATADATLTDEPITVEDAGLLYVEPPLVDSTQVEKVSPPEPEPVVMEDEVLVVEPEPEPEHQTGGVDVSVEIAPLPEPVKPAAQEADPREPSPEVGGKWGEFLVGDVIVCPPGLEVSIDTTPEGTEWAACM